MSRRRAWAPPPVSSFTRSDDAAGYPWTVVRNSNGGPLQSLPASVAPGPRLAVAGWLTRCRRAAPLPLRRTRFRRPGRAGGAARLHAHAARSHRIHSPAEHRRPRPVLQRVGARQRQQASRPGGDLQRALGPSRHGERRRAGAARSFTAPSTTAAGCRRCSRSPTRSLTRRRLPSAACSFSCRRSRKPWSSGRNTT